MVRRRLPRAIGVAFPFRTLLRDSLNYRGGHYRRTELIQVVSAPDGAS
jgi:hypothetical protein